MLHLGIAMLALAMVPSQASSDPVGEVLTALRQSTDSSLRDWDFSIDQDGNSPGRMVWSTVKLGHRTREERFRYRREIKIPAVFAGTPITGTRALLDLNVSGPIDFKASIYVDGNLYAHWPIIDPETHALGTPQIVLSEEAKPGDVFNIELACENRSVYPVHEFLGVSKTFGFNRANLVLDEAEKLRGELSAFAVNIESARMLVEPVALSEKEKQRRWPEFIDRSQIKDDTRKNLRETLRKAVVGFDRDALRAGASRQLRVSMTKVLRDLRPVGKFAKQFTIYAVGNAHIDLAWLWRKQESVQIATNTFRSVFNNMEEFPELTFAQSQAHAYRWVEESDPELFSRIREAVRAGKWDPVGGMWVEPDCNVPGGESWVRHLLYAQHYFQDNFGAMASLGWNPDSFGYNWNMPQLFKKAGIDAFVTQKLSWNDTTVFPYHLFWWEAPNKSKILAYLPTGSYVERLEPARLLDQLLRFEQNTGFKEMLVLFGLGNHGGGPNRGMLERARMLNEQPIFPKLGFIRAHDYIERLKQEDLSDLPVWRGELYMEGHRGTLTTQSRTKRNNRKSESILETAEKAAALAWLQGTPYPREAFTEAWKIVLFNQFHDILPGSSITPVYRDADEDYALARKIARRALDQSLDAMGARIATQSDGWRRLLVFNPLSWERDDIVRITLPQDAPRELMIRGPDGMEVPHEILKSEDGLDRELLFIARRMPALGYQVFTALDHQGTRFETDLTGSGSTIENKFLKVEVNPQTGNIKSILDKRTGRQVLAEGKEGNVLELHENLPSYWDAWNIGYTGRSWTVDKPDSIELVKGPVRTLLRVKKSFLGLSKANRAPTEGFPSSFFTQNIILYAGSPRVDIELESDWWEDHTLLKVSFPLNVENDFAMYEIPFASVARPTVQEEPWQKARFEVSVHRWADMSRSGFGVSLLNDGKYGMDTLGNTMRLTIHTSPNWPDPIADRGKHVCTYSVYPHEGSWQEAGTSRQAQQLNLPLAGKWLRGTGTATMPDRKSFVTAEEESVDLTCLKVSEDGDGLVLRFVETSGHYAEMTVDLPSRIRSASEIDLLEREIRKAGFSGTGLRFRIEPHEIKSFKVTLAK